jgi:hypothetical protein
MKPDKIYLFLTFILLYAAFFWLSSCSHKADISNIPEICFTGEILPIFNNNCAKKGCHDGSGESRPLNNYADIMQDIVPFNPDASHLYQTIISKWGNLMPPNQPLTQENRTKIRVWIEQGAAETTCQIGTGKGAVSKNYSHQVPSQRAK